jgi:SAM-dependent methyltransferase
MAQHGGFNYNMKYNFKKIKYKKDRLLQPEEEMLYLDGSHEDYETVKNKYVLLNKKNYGRSCHGSIMFNPEMERAFVKHNFKFEELDITSILDIGTGQGQMCDLFRRKGYKNIHGLDFAIKPLPELRHEDITFIEADAHEIPLEDNSIDLITSFDFLEHVHPDYLEKTILEMFRVGKKYMIHKIAGGPSKCQHGRVGQLHLIQEERDFWMEEVFKPHEADVRYIGKGIIFITI